MPSDQAFHAEGPVSFFESEFGARKKGPENFISNLVFVIMSLRGEEIQETYSSIKDECNRIGLDAIRIDENTGSGFIIKEIVTFIEKAEFIICDLTNERPNVYYELGYAHGVGNQPLNILLIAKEGTTLHFDIAPLRVQYYRSTEHLRSIVAKNLKEMIRLTRSQQQLPSTEDKVKDNTAHSQEATKESRKGGRTKQVKRKK
jgi:hypothetical protein